MKKYSWYCIAFTVLSVCAVAQELPYALQRAQLPVRVITGAFPAYNVNESLVESDGTTYITGWFKGQSDFDPGTATVSLTSQSATVNDAFLAKYDPQGNLLWVKAISGLSDKASFSIVKTSASKVAIAGYFVGTANFDPGASNFSLTSNGGQDGFFCRYIASTGAFDAAVSLGGPGNDGTNQILIDAAGNGYLQGYFSQTMDFDLTAAVVERTAVNAQDRFLVKYDPNLLLSWVHSFPSPLINKISLDGNNLYATGGFNIPTDMDPGPASLIKTPSGNSDIWLSKFDASGNLVWNQVMGGVGFDTSVDIAIDGNSDIVLVGNYNQTSDFDPSAATQNLVSNGSGDAFAAKYDANGSFSWARGWGGTGNELANSLVALQNNQLAIVGNYFSLSMDLDPGVGTRTVTSAGPTNFSDAFLLLLNGSGAFVEAHTYGDVSISETVGVVNGNATQFSIVGSFANSVDFDPSADVTSVTNASGLQQAYLNRYSLLASLPAAQPSALVLSNPTGSSIDVSYTASAADGYLVVRRAGSAATSPPKDGRAYFAGDFLNDGVVAYLGPATSFIDANLAANTTYHYQVYSFNNTNGAINYLTTTPLTGSSATTTITYSRATDSLALVSLYNATNGGAWTNRTNWLTGNPINTWFGVTVTGNRVTAINLASNNLNGFLTPLLGNLTSLQTLALSSNQLRGIIPDEVGNITSLVVLQLGANQLSGVIPAGLQNLSNLTTLSLSNNPFGGNIPPWLGTLTSLTVLELMNCALTGTIPANLGDLNSLTKLDIGSNFFNGRSANPIRNVLTGTIPSTLTNLVNLTSINLSGNNLTGTLPAGFENLTALTQLWINGNQFTFGAFPSQILSLTNLQFLHLSYCGITGSIPSAINSLTQLTQLYLDFNEVETLPTSLSTMTSLNNLDVRNNRLSSLPNLSSLTSLTVFRVSNNSLQFDALEPNIARLGASTNYSPQRAVGVADTLILIANTSLNLSFAIGGSANTYQWKKNTTINVGANSNTFTIPTLGIVDAGTYTLTVTSSLVAGLTLTTANQVVVIKAEAFFEWVTNAGDLTTEGLAPVNQVTDQNYSGTWGDFNNDGFEDIFVGNFSAQERSYLYKNNGNGTFSKVPNSSYFFTSGRSMQWADYNNDGFLDCFAPGGATGANDSISFASVYKNNGNETFTRIPLPTTASAGTWSDTDNDGDVDIITNGGGAFPTLFRNEGGDSFVALAAFSTNANAQWNIVTVDVNNDNAADVYIPDDIQRNFYIGNGDNTFSINTTTPLVTDVLASARGISWADIDNDGDFDAYIMGNSVGNRFYLNDGAGNFTFQPTSAILGETIFGGRGSAFADYDNDGYVDLLSIQNQVPAGWYLFKNNGNGTFTKQLTQSFKSGGAILAGASFGDYNNDGFLDISSASFGSDYNALYRNKGNTNNWLQVKLIGTLSNRSAVGAKVSVKAGGFWRHTQVLSANGFANQNSLIQQIGLGAATSADSIVITWPSGTIQTQLNVAANQRLNIIEQNSDLDALVALYDSTGGPNWTNKTNWLTGQVSTWYGVRVANGRVTDVRLQNNNLTGSIPPAIGNLTALDSLDLGANELSGTIPDVFNQGNQLEFIDLGSNQLTGSIPPTLFQATSLRTLGLARNNLTGTIPAAIGNLTNLKKLWLDENQFSGSLPNELGNLTSLTDLFVQNNRLTGVVPASLANLTNLSGCGLDNNSFTTLPTLTGLSNLFYLNVSGNQFTFESLEPNISVPGILYAPQDSLGVADTVLIPTNQPYTIRYAVGGSANTYEWKKNNITLSGVSTDSLTLGTPTFANEGVYRLQVQNSLVPGLTLFTRPTLVKVSSLKRDSIALAQLFTATNGPGWTNKTNWNVTPIASGNWFGVTIVANRVTQVNLPANNLQGPVPDDFADLEGVSTINLANNAITSLPNFTTYPNITVLNVAGNNLDFASLESNQDLTGINFANQKNPVLGPDTIFVEHGEDFVLPTDVGGNANRYQWKRAGVSVSGAVADSLIIQDIGRSNMGSYVVEVTNDLVPTLTLVSKPVTILATADLSGKLLINNDPAKAGIARLFRVTSSNGYDTIQTQAISATGDYAFNNVVLDDYQIVGFADTLVAGQERALPTYYKSTLYWEEADTLFVNESRNDLNIISQLEPTAPLLGDGVIAGIVEEDDGLGSRGLGTKRVGGAGVSARRTQGTGRGGEVFELIAYVYTNEEGEFIIDGLVPGTYRLNIQYPGFPMDAESDIDLTIGNSPLDEVVTVEAIVAEGKIAVRQLIVTSLEGADYKADVYPNPARQQVTISFEETAAGRTVSLMDANGREIDKRSATGITATLDVRAVPTGLYLVKVRENGKAVKTVRLSVQ